MINQKVTATLGGYAYRYGRFTEFWAKAKQGIMESFDLEGYEVEQEEREEGTAIYFRLFGAKCYVAFTHDLEKGKLEYGVVDPRDSQEQRRIQCSALEFDVNANLGEVGAQGAWSIADPKSVQSVHLSLISKIAPQLVSVFYDAYHGREMSE